MPGVCNNFARVPCPPDVHIPTDDVDAYKFHPSHRWIYDKPLVAQSQGLACGLHDSTAERPAYGAAHSPSLPQPESMCR
jgi:hypothetical protein